MLNRISFYNFCQMKIGDKVVLQASLPQRLYTGVIKDIEVLWGKDIEVPFSAEPFVNCTITCNDEEIDWAFDAGCIEDDGIVFFEDI